MEMSARRCQGWRKILRCPPPGMKLVSNWSPAGIAEQGIDPSDCCGLATRVLLQGYSSGTVKQDAFRAGRLKSWRIAPVPAFWGVQPGASGTMGFVIPSFML